MENIKRLQKWYRSQCNEDWEHQYGIKIETLDNPGWAVKIDLVNTYLEEIPFEKVAYGIGEQAELSGEDWLVCEVKGGQFTGFAGPFKLTEILDIFLNWAEGKQN